MMDPCSTPVSCWRHACVLWWTITFLKLSQIKFYGEQSNQ